jgi:cytoskeletal protein CcmA (bactofilin family)
MFSKQAKSGPKAAGRAEAPTSLPSSNPADPTRRATPKVASLLSADLTIEGCIEGEGELQLDGILRGDVRVARLSVGETGHVEGSVHADLVEVRGRIVGTITAKQVRLYGTAYVDGDITHEQLSMESGAYFQGRSLKFQRPPAPIQPTPEPEVLAIAAAQVEA